MTTDQLKDVFHKPHRSYTVTRNTFKKKTKPRHKSTFSDIKYNKNLADSSSSFIGLDINAKSDGCVIKSTQPSSDVPSNNRRNSNSISNRPISARKHYFQQKNLYTGRSRSKLYYYSSSEREDNVENEDRPKFDRIHSDPNRVKYQSLNTCIVFHF